MFKGVGLESSSKRPTRWWSSI